MIANNVVGAGVDPAAVPPRELAQLVEARERIPRQAFDEAIGKLGEPGFAADAVPRPGGGLGRRRARAGRSTRCIAANPGQVAA